MSNPLSALFGAGVKLRNTLYDRQIFKVQRLQRPVVSIGNISTGGSGKTPFVIALGKLLQQKGIAFDVLSRGYGRRGAGVAQVDRLGTADQYGDEPLLIARKLQAPVFVGAERYQAGTLAEKAAAGQLHLLDDGFQHRQLHRDFDIVLLPDEDREGRLLPAGRLREPLSSLRRADVVVLAPAVPMPAGVGVVWRAERKVQVAGVPQRPVAFCGIARPQQFFSSLRQLGIEPADTLVFPDHHRYSNRDVERLLRARRQAGAGDFVTTEKDAINLGPLIAQLPSVQIVALEVTLCEPEAALTELLASLEERCGCRF